MNTITILTFLCLAITLASCNIYTIQNPDGSYTIGLNPEPSNSLNNLPSNYEQNPPTSPNPIADSQNLSNSVFTFTSNSVSTVEENPSNEVTPTVTSPPLIPNVTNINLSTTSSSTGLLGPHLEIVRLIETFVRFKGELASRIYALLSDNYELIQSIYRTVASNLGTLHTFTLNGISILRSVLELANNLMAQWQINLPSVGVDVNVTQPNGQEALFHFMKNGNSIRG